MIELRQVVKRIEGVTVLDGLSLQVQQRECVAVVGASGAGKTTLLRLIAGLDRPDAGQILLRGEEVSSAGICLPSHERRLGFQFQEPALWPHMTLIENVAYGVRNHRARALECLRSVGLHALAKRRPGEVSGGEARRAALARALAPRRDIVLLDEPLTGLPASLREGIAAWVAYELRAADAACLWVTHDAAETEGLAGRVLTLADGVLR